MSILITRSLLVVLWVMVAIGNPATAQQSNQKALIIETLSEVGLPFNSSVVDLMLGTMAVESDFGKYERQFNNGPAIGIFQMEPNTIDDLIINYLDYRPRLKHKAQRAIESYLNSTLIGDHRSQIILCRLQYMRFKSNVPSDLDGLAHYWKTYWNSSLGKGTEEKFKTKYKLYVW